MKKAVIGPYELVANIALIATLVVAVVIFYPVLKEVFLQSEGKGECEVGIVLSSMLKRVTYGVAEDLPFECRMKDVIITAGKVNDELGKSKGKNTDWAVQKLVADEMVDCFNRAWRGKLDLKGVNLKSILSEKGNELLCFLCARVEFDQSFFDSFGIKKPAPIKFVEPGQSPYWDYAINMESWLKENNYDGKTYYDFLTGGIDPFYRGKLDTSYVDYSTPSAILFIIDFTGKGGIRTARYDALRESLDFSMSIDKYGGLEKSGGFAKCTQIIGD